MFTLTTVELVGLVLASAAAGALLAFPFVLLALSLCQVAGRADAWLEDEEWPRTEPTP